jgi:hypothetical protein
MGDIFISYAREDREKAKVLAHALVRYGWSVWWDRDIPPGRQFDEVIEEALTAAGCVIVLWSRHSITSSWVKTEAADAMRRRVLFPIFIEEDVKIPLEFRRLQAADLSKWQGDADDPALSVVVQLLRAQFGGLRDADRTFVGRLAQQPAAVAPAARQSRFARLGSLATNRVALAVVGAVTLGVVAIVGYAIWASTIDDPTPTGKGAWLADSKGCKYFEPDPVPKQSISWTGSCAKGKLDGTGTLELYTDGKRTQRATGRFSEGQPTGPMTIFDDATNLTFEGEMQNGQFGGRVVITTSQAKIETNFVNGKPKGNVVITSKDGARYEGGIKDMKRDGEGTLVQSDGTKYVGVFVNGQLEGHAVMTSPTGARYDGQFRRGERNGRGDLTLPSGDRYVGEFADGRYNGYGVLTASDGRRYEGDFKNGQRTGKGIESFPNGDRYVGEFLAGKFHGHGTFTTAKGQRYEGNFIAGQLVR